MKLLAPTTGTVWKVEAAVGETLEEGDAIVILESMKMEIPVEAPADGEVVEVRVVEGQAVAEKDVVAVFRRNEKRTGNREQRTEN